jgi:hypothetical protein
MPDPRIRGPSKLGPARWGRGKTAVVMMAKRKRLTTDRVRALLRGDGAVAYGWECDCGREVEGKLVCARCGRHARDVLGEDVYQWLRR